MTVGFETYNDALVQFGGQVKSGITIRTDKSIFKGGDWVNYKKIPVLSGGIKASDLESFYFNVLTAQIANFAWQQQGVYFSCYPMTFQQCKFPWRYIYATTRHMLTHSSYEYSYHR